MSVLSRSSRIHCRTEDTLVATMSVCTPHCTSAANPITVLPAPQGSTSTPLPPAVEPCDHQAPTASPW